MLRSARLEVMAIGDRPSVLMVMISATVGVAL